MIADWPNLPYAGSRRAVAAEVRIHQLAAINQYAIAALISAWVAPSASMALVMSFAFIFFFPLTFLYQSEYFILTILRRPS